MKKEITYNDAYKKYLDEEWYEIMPFDNSIEKTFIEYLTDLGYLVIK